MKCNLMGFHVLEKHTMKITTIFSWCQFHGILMECKIHGP